MRKRRRRTRRGIRWRSRGGWGEGGSHNVALYYRGAKVDERYGVIFKAGGLASGDTKMD